MKNLPLCIRSMRAIGAVALFTLLVSGGQAQNREKFGISARAGGVNSVAGSVMIQRTDQSPIPLTAQDDLKSGDVVTTGPTGQAEVLLNPGSYLRVGANSEFALVDNSLDNLVVRLIKGSAIIEATGGDDAQIRINLLTNQQPLMIIRGGIYRVNVQPGFSELLVRKGRVLAGGNPRGIVKGGTKVTYATGGPLIARLSKKDQDEFDLWSKKRAETLARANERISQRAVNGYLSSMDPFEWLFSAANSSGLWTYSSFSRCYTFVPFRWGWSSPYGHSYGNYYGVGPYSSYPGYGPNSAIVTNPNSGGASTGYPGGGSSGGSTRGAGSSPSIGSPMNSTPSQAGPRDPDSGSRSINRIKNPN